MAAQRKMTFGIVVGNRGFFPDHLAKSGREEILAALEAAGAQAVVLGPEESKYGAVETYTESERCAELFKKHAGTIDGIVVTLPTSARSAASSTPSASPGSRFPCSSRQRPTAVTP